MGKCQDFRHRWTSMDDVIQFALNMDKKSRTAFLIVIGTVIWCIWKQHNDLCFQNSIVHSCRNVILSIISIIIYWTGQLNEEMQTKVNEWLPKDMDDVPLQIVQLEDEMMLEWISGDSN